MHADNSGHLDRWRAQEEAERRARTERLLALGEAGKASWGSIQAFLDQANADETEEALVRRTWLYESEYAERVCAVRDSQRKAGHPVAVPRVQRSTDDSLRERLSAALAENQRLRAANAALTTDLANALGLLRQAQAGGKRGR